MDLKKIKQIVNLVSESGVHEVEVEQDGFKIRVTRSASIPEGSQIPFYHAAAPAPAAQVPAPTVAASAPNAAPVAKDSTASSEASGKTLKSPIVGTFYASPSPGEDAFVKEGDRVEKGQTLCIIEAMKIMNEIEAEESGVIKQILVEDAQPVEYDQPLFIIE